MTITLSRDWPTLTSVSNSLKNDKAKFIWEIRKVGKGVHWNLGPMTNHLYNNRTEGAAIG